MFAVAACLCNVVEVESAPRAENPGLVFFQAFDGALWAKWSGYERMAKFSLKTIEEVFRAFLLSEYYATMGDVLEEMERVSIRVLEAAVPVSTGGASPAEQQARSALLALAHDADMIRVDECIEAEYVRLAGEMAPVMREMLPDSCSVDFRRQRYYTVLTKVVEERQRSVMPSCLMGQARVQPEDGCDDAEEVDRRRSLLKLMTPSMFLSVEAQFESQWKADIDAGPPALRSILPSEPPR